MADQFNNLVSAMTWLYGGNMAETASTKPTLEYAGESSGYLLSPQMLVGLVEHC